MKDVTDTWPSFAEAKGAEYLAEYVTIWHCEACGAMVGAEGRRVQWVMERDEAPSEEEAG
jgi:hypothetical protein